jgi:CxxC-x17-CxxC domain-containing protein
MSAFADKTLKCLDCNQDFTYTAAEQELHKSLGYQNEPKRCNPCREAKRQRKGGGERPPNREPRPPRPAGGDPRAPRGPRPPRPPAPPREPAAPAREYFMAICQDCGKEAQLPFKPRGDKPLYCGDCFEKRRTG